MSKLWDEIKKQLGDNKEPTQDDFKKAIESISGTGKFVPEEKFLSEKAKSKDLESTIKNLNDKLEKFEGIDPDDSKKSQEELKILKEQLAKDKEEQSKLEAEKKLLEKTEKAKQGIIEKLKSEGAIEPELLVDKVISKSGGIDKLEFDNENKLITDIDFAVNFVKQEHTSIFSEVKPTGGGSGAGAGAGAVTQWTTDSVKDFSQNLTDQQRIDKAKEDPAYAKASGLTAYLPATE